MSEYSSFVNPMDVYTSAVMVAIRQIIAFGALLLGSFGAVCGCHSGFDWQGDWSGKRNIATVPGTSPDLINSIQRVTLTVKPNGEYVLHASGVPTSGIFKSSGKDATLEPVTMLDRPLTDAQPVKIKANEDGTITLSSPDNLDSRPIQLHRESQPTDPNVRKQ